MSCDEILQTIEQRFAQIRSELGLRYDVEGEMEALRARLDRSMSVDELVSRGEYFTARLMAEYLGYAFVDAAECVFFGFDGQLDREKTDRSIAAALSEHGRIVIPGFYGRLPTGLMADPRIVPDPRPIEKVTYAELRELAFMGASVMHEESIEPVKEKGIALNIRNTNRPDDPGTLIVGDALDRDDGERFITGIAGKRDFTIITVTKRDMNANHTLCQALEIMDRYHAPVEHITLGLDSFALVSGTNAMGDALYDVLADIRKTCRPDDVRVQEDIALVAAVGRKMSSRPGISGRLFKALGDAGVNIRTIAQGADELAITVGVDNKDFETAIRVLYNGFAG